MSSPISTIKPQLRDLQCPGDLRTLPGWLMWRLEHHDGEAKPRKVPYYTDGGKRYGVQGREEDRQRLTTFDAAKAAAARKGFDGVGFAPMPEWQITALDFDNCVVDGGVHADVERLVAGTYAEFSPSGKGVRAFVRGQLGNRKDAHGLPFGIETFGSRGFVTYTGNVLPVTELTDCANTIADVTDDLSAYCARRFGREASSEPAPASDTPPLGLSDQQLRDALDVLDPSMSHDQWLRVGMSLHHETSGAGFALWDTWSASGDTYPGSEALQARWDSFGRGGQTPVTAHALVRMANANGAHIETAILEGDVFDVLPDEPAAPPKPNRFAVEPLDTFVTRPAPTWLIKNVLPAADLIVLYGESGAGKSFVALDLAGCIAQGLPWRGQRVRKGRVVYVAAEGSGGFRNRVVAYCMQRGLNPADLDIGVIPAAPNLMLHDDAIDVCKSIMTWGTPDLVIVDTFAQVTPGANENAAEDMGKALANCRGIRRATGAPVMLVHHSGKDATRGARGWSGLKAAADAELEVAKGVGGRVLRTTKQKDGDGDLAWGFNLQVLPIGEDSDGDPITSCVVIEAELPAAGQVGAIKRKLGKWEQHVVAVLSEFAAVQTTGIESTAVLDAVVEREPRGNENVRDTRRQHARRALTTLLNEPDGPYDMGDDGCISII